MTFEEKRDAYLRENFKCDEDGMLKKIRVGKFDGNGRLSAISWDDLEELASWANAINTETQASREAEDLLERNKKLKAELAKG